MGMNDINSLSHTKWNCKYHIVFAPKYRRKVFYYEKRAAVGKILRQLCEWKGGKSDCSGSMPGSHPSIRRNSTKDCSIELYGISQRQEQYYAIRAIRRTQI